MFQKIVSSLGVVCLVAGCSSPSVKNETGESKHKAVEVKEVKGDTAAHGAVELENPARQPVADQYYQLRGNPAEYDPGAPKKSRWVELYSSAPNYRQIGRMVKMKEPGEKFRWEMGPMWYRGRLGTNQVKAFVVGQEGAQDENISNRAFTGSTGTKTQRFLNFLGIYRSYLFMNTFVYTINGQLADDPGFKFLEQGIGVSDPELSPIVNYRHRLFDNMIMENEESVALFMGVGSGGKASLATWINSRGGNCSTKNDMAECDASGMKEFFRKGFTNRNGERISANIKGEILVIGVPHPGGASAANGGAGALDNIIRGFTTAAKKVAKFKTENRGWMPLDIDDPLCNGEVSSSCEKARIAEMNKKFDYKDAGIPYRDFAFGTNDRMGDDGTTSNRNKADSIQVFSKYGVYGDKSARYNEKVVGKFDYAKSNIESAGFKKGVEMPWEPPRWGSENAVSYDYGPCGDKYNNYEFYAGPTASNAPCAFSNQITNMWGTTANGQSMSFGPTSIYRGNLAKANVLVIADQTSHDDFFSGRALTGETGQRLQTWLDKNGYTSKYLILRTSPWDVLADDGSVNEEVLAETRSQLKRVISGLMKNGKFDKIVTLGKFAADVGREVAGGSGAVAIDSEVKKMDLSPIPREDLPYHSRWWMGTSGNRAARGNGGALKAKGSSDGVYHYYRVFAPDWNSKYSIPGLSRSDEQLLNEPEAKKFIGK